MALKLKEETITVKATLNTGDYSNLVFEVTLTADIETARDAIELRMMAQDALTAQVEEATRYRLIAGIPALNGKVGDQRRAALEAQPCTKVLATLDPELAKQVVNDVLGMSLAPEKKATLADLSPQTVNNVLERRTRQFNNGVVEDREFE